MIYLVSALSPALSQNLALECDFFDEYNGYGCLLNNITVLDRARNLTIGGEHIGNFTNADVRIVRITNSNTPFVIEQIFTTFENVRNLQIYDSHLESINLPNATHLREIYFIGNNISRIENATFINHPQLIYLNLRNNQILELDEDAFLGLSLVIALGLNSNHITNIAPRTFHPLVNATYLNLEGNNLSSIGNEVFSQNTHMETLYLENNQISEITPRFTSRFGTELSYINLAGNVCIDRSFSMSGDEEFGRILIHNGLRKCFQNFIGTVPELREITFQFRGPLRLFDEFGNLIASVPE